MARSLTYLSAAICFAASWNPTAHAAPATSDHEDPNFLDLRGPVVANSIDQQASFGVQDLVGSKLLSGFGPHELLRDQRFDFFTAWPVSTQTPQNVSSAVDANDFILPGWMLPDASVAALSRPESCDSPLFSIESVSLTSSDVETLSVPEVPLPLNVIPAFAGIVMVLVFHNRSLKRRNMPK